MAGNDFGPVGACLDAGVVPDAVMPVMQFFDHRKHLFSVCVGIAHEYVRLFTFIRRKMNIHNAILFAIQISGFPGPFASGITPTIMYPFF